MWSAVAGSIFVHLSRILMTHILTAVPGVSGFFLRLHQGAANELAADTFGFEAVV